MIRWVSCLFFTVLSAILLLLAFDVESVFFWICTFEVADLVHVGFRLSIEQMLGKVTAYDL